MHVFHCSGRLELLCYSLKGYGYDFSWNISNFVCIFLRSNVVNLNIVLCLNIIFRSKRVTSKIQSWLILCNVNKIHMPCFCLREPIKISLYLFFSIFWNLNMNTNSFEIFFISFKKNWNTGFLFFFFSALSVNKNIKQNWKTFSWNWDHIPWNLYIRNGFPKLYSILHVLLFGQHSHFELLPYLKCSCHHTIYVSFL